MGRPACPMDECMARLSWFIALLLLLSVSCGDDATPPNWGSDGPSGEEADDGSSDGQGTSCLRAGSLDCGAGGAGACCSDALCVQDTSGGPWVCAATCREGAECWSGCCDTLVNSGDQVCSEGGYCNSSLGEFCEQLGSLFCEIDYVCGGYNDPSCRQEFIDHCCRDEGICGGSTLLSGATVAGCLRALATYDCAEYPDTPVQCLF